MIHRYSSEAVEKIFAQNSIWTRWLQVEQAVLEHQIKKAIVPKKDAQPLAAKLKKIRKFDAKKIAALESDLKHDVLAFTTYISDVVGVSGRYLHFGLTSSDVVDTASSIAVLQAVDLLTNAAQIYGKKLNEFAEQFRDFPTMGRTHGMYAEPTTLGLKFLSFAQEWQRFLSKLSLVKTEISFGKLSGAVGASPHFSPEDEKIILLRLGLQREPVSTQVLPRDRWAFMFSVFALGASAIERMALEVRLLQRSEVNELREGFSGAQKGSSAMPHKRNPIGCENLTGLSRLVRSYLVPAFENIALWHERDISHSSVERVLVPDVFHVMHTMILRATNLVQNLQVNTEVINNRVEKESSLGLSGHLLLALVRAGASREKAYRWVQQCAHESIDQGIPLFTLVKSHPEISKRLDGKLIAQCLSVKNANRHIDQIFEICKK